MLDRYSWFMTAREQHEEPHLLVLSPEQALAAARPLPEHDRLVIDGVTDEEWGVFFAALTEQ